MALDTEAPDQYASLDTTAIAAEIGASLFSKSDTSKTEANPLADEITEASAPVQKTEAPVAAETPPAEKAPVETAPAANAPGVIPGENSVPVALPKSWKKDLAPEWEKASPAIKAYVHEREAQVMRGINQYAQGYQAWDNLTKPFQSVLEANPQINPISLMQGLMATHLQLLSPTVPAGDKQKLVTNLLSSYGISLAPGEGPAADSVLLDRLARAEQGLRLMQETEGRRAHESKQATIQTFKSQVDAFEADPKNEHFGEVANDILRFIQTGAATDLASAYELACWANPAVRAKMQAKQLEEKAPTAQKPRGKNGQFLNLEGDGEVKPIKVKPGTMENTIDAVIAKHYPKH